MATHRILYLDVAPLEEGKALRGGALVVDTETEPLEFRCTTAVRPTRLQRILWGARLEGHLAADLLGRPLIKSLTESFSLVLVRAEEFLEIRPDLDVPLLYVSRDTAIEFEDGPASADDGEGLEPTDDGPEASEQPAAASGGLLSSPLGRFEPVVLRSEQGHDSDKQAGREILQPIFAVRDVLEPFDRIRVALETVHRDETEKAGR